VADGRVTDVRPQAGHPVSRGQLCAKGWNGDKFLADPERLTTPLVRRASGSRPCRGDEALDAAADALVTARRDGEPMPAASSRAPVNQRYVCTDGPVFSFAERCALPDAFGPTDAAIAY
jgi:anaerobic selenocysteine-containing dehydrogenase